MDQPFSFMAGFRSLEALLFECYVHEEIFMRGEARATLKGE